MLAVLAALVALCASLGATQDRVGRPNVVVLVWDGRLSESMLAGDSPVAELVQEGVRFTQALVPVTRGEPSERLILESRWPQRGGGGIGFRCG